MIKVEAALDANSSIAPTDKFHSLSSPYIILDREYGENKLNFVASSYISCLLKFASKSYGSYIDFEDLNLQEWRRVTKYDKRNQEETARNTQFLHTLEQFLNALTFDPDVVKGAICSYFNVHFGTKVFTLDDFSGLDESNGGGQCCLYVDPADGSYQLILHRRVRYPQAEARAQNIIESLRESTKYEEYFKRELAKEADPFLMRKKYLEISDQLIKAQTVVGVFAAVGLSFESCAPDLSKLLMECEEPSLGANTLNDADTRPIRKSSLTPEASRRCAFELKDLMLDELKSSVEVLFRILRESKAKKERTATEAIRGVTEEIVNKTFTDNLVKLRVDPKRISGGGSSIQMLKRARFIHKLISYMESNRPASLQRSLNYKKRLDEEKWTNFSFLVGNFPQDIPVVLCGEEKLPRESLEKVIERLKEFVSPEFIEPELEETTFKFEATHLYLSQCITLKLMDWLDLFRERYKNQEILVQFVGHQSITIDVDLEKSFLHGIHLYFETRKFFVGETIGKMYKIDVGGLDGAPHATKKAPKPTATGCNGNDGLHGNPGESSGNVLMVVKEDFVGYEYLELLCHGGNGADGQDAGDGTHGDNGVDGRDGELLETPPSTEKRLLKEGTKGTNGENGGSSGQIGAPGAGGYGGAFEIYRGSVPITIAGEDGKPGKPGQSGEPGKGGRGGIHGVDKAWIKYSGYVWHPWELVKGKQGAEKLVLLHHNGWFVEGYTVQDHLQIPPTQNGIPGQKLEEQNMTAVLGASLRTNMLKQNEIAEMQNEATEVEDKTGDGKGQNKIQACMQKQAILRLQERKYGEKLREIDELRDQANSDFSRLKQELSMTLQATQTVEQFSIQNQFHQLSLSENENRRTSTNNQHSDLQMMVNTNEDDEQMLKTCASRGEGWKKVSFLAAILKKIDDTTLHQAGEKYLKEFTFEDESTWWNAVNFFQMQVVTKDEMKSGPRNRSVLHVLKLVPAAHKAFKDVDMSEFPKLSIRASHPDNPLVYFSELVELAKLNLYNTADSLLCSEYFTTEQKKILKEFLTPFYATQFVPTLQDALKASQTSKLSRIRNKFRFGAKNDSSKNPEIGPSEEEMYEDIVETILDWLVLLENKAKNKPTEVIEGFQKYVKNNTDTNKTLQQLLEKYFAKEILECSTDDITSLADEDTAEIIRNLWKANFILRNFELGPKELDQCYSIYWKLMRKGKQIVAPTIKTATQAGFATFIQNPIQEEIFQYLNYSAEETSDRRQEVEDMVDKMESFEKKSTCLNALKIKLATAQKGLDWNSTMKEFTRGFAFKEEEFKASVDGICSDELATQNCIDTLRIINYSLRYGHFTNLYTLERSLIKMENYLIQDANTFKFTLEVVEEFESSVKFFWENKLREQVVDVMRERFDPKKYESWKLEVMDEAKILLESNLVLEREEYADYLELKLSQLVHFGLIDGRIKELKRHRLHDEGDELQRLRSILDALPLAAKIPNIELQPTLCEEVDGKPSMKSLFEDFMESVELLKAKHESPDQLHTACLLFAHRIGQLVVEIGKRQDKNIESQFMNFLQVIELRLVADWTNVHGLVQLQDSYCFELDHQDKTKLDACFMKSFFLETVKPSNISQQCKLRIKCFLDMLKHFLTNNLKELNKHFDVHFRNLAGKVEQEVLDLEILLQNHRVPLLMSKGIANKKTTVSAYIDKWEDFKGSWDQLLQQEMKIFGETLRETQDDAAIVIGDSKDSSIPDVLIAEESFTDDLTSYSRQILTQEELILKLDTKFAELPATLLALKLALEVFEGLKFGKKEKRLFLEKCLTLEIGTAGKEFYELLKTVFSKCGNVVGLNSFCDPRVNNATRKLISRFNTSDLSKAKLSDDQQLELVKIFLTPSDSESGQLITTSSSVMENLRRLLSPVEEEYFGKIMKMKTVDGSQPAFCGIPTSLTLSPSWELDLRHFYVECLIGQLVSSVDEDSKRKVAEKLYSWSQRFIIKGNSQDHHRWLELMTTLGTELRMFPISFIDLLSLLSICERIPLHSFENLLQSRVPPTYLKYAMLARLAEFLSTKLAKSDITTGIQFLDSLLICEEKEISESFLAKFGELIATVKSPDEIRAVFTEIISPAIPAKGSRRMILEKWTSLPLKEWKQQLRISFYMMEFPDTKPSLMERIIKLDSKFDPVSTAAFLEHLHRVPFSPDDMETLINETLLKEWVVDSELIERIKSSTHFDQLVSILSKYAAHYKTNKLEGGPLVDSILNINKDSAYLAKPAAFKTKLLADIRNVRVSLKNPSAILKIDKKIKDWNETDILDWVDEFEDLRKSGHDASDSALSFARIRGDTNLDETTIPTKSQFKDKDCLQFSIVRREMLGVIQRGIQIQKEKEAQGKVTGAKAKTKGGKKPQPEKSFLLHDTQIASILHFIYAANEGRGRFGEIGTSEGKTFISAVSALALALAGHNIYVITSSPVLAEDGYIRMEGLFTLFGIGVGNIADPELRTGTGNAEEKLKKLYTHRVLYGDAASFEADFLHCNYLEKTYKGGSEAHFLIVDEVDSLLLDKCSSVLYISNSIPELKFLRNIFLHIWNLALSGSPGTPQSGLKLAIYRSVKMKFVQTKEAKISKFLKSFVEQRLPVWINNAFVAKEMKQNVPYILSDGAEKKVMILDMDTGVEQKQTQYSYGLHQFLQLKEGNKISAESLKAVFISNVGYFSRFKRRIFGITGTLGESNAKGVLSELYRVDFFKMPRHLQKKCRKEAPQFFKAEQEKEYKEAVFRTVRQGPKENRSSTQPILFICETVKQCKELYGLLVKGEGEHKGVEKDKLICIYESKEYEKFRERMKVEKIPPGVIIISTNLAGRGTDIDLSPDCDAEGLHVVLAYIPPNRRVEKQAFGRTSRMGKNGSIQYLVLLDDNYDLDIESHWEIMEEREALRLEQVRARHVPQIILEENLFKKFAKKLKEVKEKFVMASHKKLVIEAKMCILKNRWAFWFDTIQCQLQIHQSNPESAKKLVYEKFQDFCDELDKISGTSRHAEGKLCSSPSDFLKLAHAYEESEGNIEMSITLLTKGIDEEPDFNETLHYYRAVAVMKKEEGLSSSKLEIRKEARKDLKIAAKKISLRKQNLHEAVASFKTLVENFMNNGDAPDFSNLTNQIEKDCELLGSHETMFLGPALGHPIDETAFRRMQSVNQDDEESKAIFNALLTENGLLKPLRLSQKVTIAKNGMMEFNGGSLDFEKLGLTAYRDVLTQVFRELIGKNYKKSFEAGSLEKAVITREEVMDKIRSAKFENYDTNTKKTEQMDWIQGMTEYNLLRVYYDEKRFADEFLDHFEDQKITIAKVLGDKNLCGLTEEEAITLFAFQKSKGTEQPEEETTAIIKLLTQKKFLVKQEDFKGSIHSGCRNDLKYVNGRLSTSGIPKSLQTYVPYLTSLVVGYDGKINCMIDTAELSLFVPNSDPSATRAERQEVVSLLLSEGILKQAKVNWPLPKWCGKEDVRRSQIQALFEWQDQESTPSSSLVAKLRTIYYKFHKQEYDENKSKEIVKKSFAERAAGWAEKVLEWDFATRTEAEIEFKKYLEDIRDVLIQSVGVTKILPHLKVEAKNLSTYYTGRDVPEEFYALRDEGFDKVPVLKEKLPWWSAGVLTVALLGILQLAAGVAVAVLSAGTLANVSMMLISEGGGDLFFAANSAWTGSFSWKSYGIHKVFSVGCSIATGGLGGVMGGSWGTVIALEVAEEILKKTLWTVGRYTVQAVGAVVANMTIEKVLDWVKAKLLSMARTAFQVWAVSCEAYKEAKTRLAESMHKVYEASFREGQLETSILNATKELGPRSSTSMFAHTLNSSMRRVASLYMAKLTEKLSSGMAQGLLDNGVKLFNVLASILSRVTDKVVCPMETFAAGHVERLAEYFEKQAAELQGKKKPVYTKQTDKTRVESLIATTVANIDSEVVDAALDKLQHEIAEPFLKEGCARWFDSKLNSAFEAQANYEMLSAGTGSFSLESTSAIHTFVSSTEDRENRNNVWNSHLAQKAGSQLQDYWDKFQAIQGHCTVATLSGVAGVAGAHSVVFVIDGATKDTIWQAENLGLNFARKFKL